MKKMRNLTIATVALFLTGCALRSDSVSLYSEQLVERPYTESHRVLLPPPEGISEYSPATAEAWNRTYNECVQIREWMAHEIAQRRVIASNKRWLFTTFSAATAMASVAYSGIVDDPKSKILIPLGLASGTSAVTLQEATTRDARLDSLTTRIARLDAAQRQAIKAMQSVEQSVTVGQSTEVIEQRVADLQVSLGEWQLLCQ